LLNKTARLSPRVFAPSSAVMGALNAFGLFAPAAQFGGDAPFTIARARPSTSFRSAAVRATRTRSFEFVAATEIHLVRAFWYHVAP